MVNLSPLTDGINLAAPLLGVATAYPLTYAPQLLRPIARALGREGLRLPEPLPFYGVDVWGAYELAWCDAAGRPQAGSGLLQLKCDSPRLIESKSLKLYLFSLNDCRFADREAYAACVQEDLCQASGAPVQLIWDRAGANIATLPEAACIDHAPWRAPPPRWTPRGSSLRGRLSVKRW